MIVLKAALTSVLSMLVLFFLTKLTGNKQISQMSMFDYIAGITIGSSAAEMAIGGEIFIPATVVTVLYGVAAFIISYTCNKSVRARRFLNGEPVILFQNGFFFKENMSKVRMDMGEFLTQCRANGIFSMREVFCVIMEPNGKVSVMKKGPSGEQSLCANVVLDGRILKENLEHIGKNEWWLMSELDKKKIKVSSVMLANVDQGKLYVYPFSEDKGENKLFE